MNKNLSQRSLHKDEDVLDPYSTLEEDENKLIKPYDKPKGGKWRFQS